MDLSWLVRARWRLVGAWMWPAFVVFAAADAAIVHVLPLAGDTQSVVGGLVIGLIVNLIAVVLLARPLGMLVRALRRDIPVEIARNYAGTACVLAATLALAAIGLGHRASINDDHADMHDATTRAAAWIGDHAPARFRADAADLSVVVIQSDVLYRACAGGATGDRQFCVVVDERSGSVVPAGSEPNQSLAEELN